MPTPDQVLLHQVHPLKLAADIAGSVISNVAFWQHSAVLGIVIRLALPVAGSAVVLRFADVERLRPTPAGQYVLGHMPRSATGLRFAGDLVMALGCWFHQPAAIAAGVATIGAGWSHGLISRRGADSR